MTDCKNKGGRPWLTIQQKENHKQLILSKLEPWLMTGISINKALKAAQIHNSEFYKYLKEDRLFGEKIAHFRNFIPVLVCKIMFTEFMSIARRQQEAGGLSKDDRDFVMWFATHSNTMSDLYGRREKTLSFDPQEDFKE